MCLLWTINSTKHFLTILQPWINSTLYRPYQLTNHIFQFQDYALTELRLNSLELIENGMVIIYASELKQTMLLSIKYADGGKFLIVVSQIYQFLSSRFLIMMLKHHNLRVKEICPKDSYTL